MGLGFDNIKFKPVSPCLLFLALLKLGSTVKCE